MPVSMTFAVANATSTLFTLPGYRTSFSWYASDLQGSMPAGEGSFVFHANAIVIVTVGESIRGGTDSHRTSRFSLFFFFSLYIDTSRLFSLQIYFSTFFLRLPLSAMIIYPFDLSI